MGGEKLFAKVGKACHQGSPPRGRGKAAPEVVKSYLSRITPAWAGKSKKHRLPFGLDQDHPRVGGEKCEPVSWATGATGSPPRGRGKGCARSPRAFLAGITPAWAGKRSLRMRSQISFQDHPRVGGEKATKGGEELGLKGSPPRGRGKA